MKKFYIGILFFISVVYCDAQIIDGYTDKLSYRSGEVIKFFTKHSGSQPSFDLKDFGGNIIPSTLPFSFFNTAIGTSQPTPSATSYMDSYSYTQTNTWQVDPISAAFSSGYYLLNYNDPNNNIPIIIKGDNTTADIVIVCPTNTINAYSESNGITGNGSLYHISNTIVSFKRPQSRANYGNCDDGFLDWIRAWNATLTTPYKLNFISDMDLDDLTTGWAEIQNAKLLIIPGHSEYWTRRARINFDRFVDAGKNALILSGNTMWVQVRYQTDPINPDNPQMVCYRGGNWCDPGGTGCFQEDNYTPTHPLQRTYHWGEPDLKYSIIGSIGSDSWNGGYGNSSCSPCGTQSFPFADGGFRITHSPSSSTPSPLFKASPITTLITFTTDNANHPIIPLIDYTNFSNSDEFDGTLVIRDNSGQALDISNQPLPDITSGNLDNTILNPQLDLSALGFYRAEMVGYHRNTTLHYLNTTSTLGLPQDWNNRSPQRRNSFCPLMVFQKTSTSGIIINVNSNRWCFNYINHNPWSNPSSNDPRASITANMISLLLNPSFNVFSTPTPTSPFISLKPEYSNVTYLACEDGSIDIKPTGIFLNNAYKVDDGWVRNSDHSGGAVPFMHEENAFISAARIDHNCSQYYQLRLAHSANNESNENDKEQTEELGFSLFPNPATGKFTLKLQSDYISDKNIYIFNSIDQKIYSKEKTLEQSIDIDLSVQTKGIYFVKVVEGNKVVTRKIVIM